MAFRLKAHPGFKRHLYELDAPSRIILSACDWSFIKTNFDPDAFFETGLTREKLSRSALKQRLRETDKHTIAFDVEGNLRGIRRFSKAIYDKNGRFVHLLCIAEAAISKSNMDAHVEHYMGLINAASSKLVNYLIRE